jgi:hypothetical protein
MSVKLALLPDMHSEQTKVETSQPVGCQQRNVGTADSLATQNFRVGFIGVFVLILTLPAMLC